MKTKKVNPFKLRDFVGVNPLHVAQLATLGIKNANQMLIAGRTPRERHKLAAQSGVPEENVLELVRLSDLARLPGVKGIRARLYHDAGVDSVEKLASYEPENLLLLTGDFVKRTGFAGIPPLPKEVSSTIATARSLEKVVEW